MMDIIKYKSGYKYQLHNSYRVQVGIFPNHDIHTQFVSLLTSGMLYISAGYAWDGASGIAIDTNNFMRGSLVHDALYQLLRSGKLAEAHRADADKVLRKIVHRDGMSWLRAWWVYKAVRALGSSAASPNSTKQILTAPNRRR